MAVYQDLVDQYGFAGQYNSVKRFVARGSVASFSGPFLGRYDGADMAGLVTLSTLPGMVGPPLALGTLRGLQGQLQGLGGGIRRQGSAHRPGQRNPV